MPLDLLSLTLLGVASAMVATRRLRSVADAIAAAAAVAVAIAPPLACGPLAVVVVMAVAVSDRDRQLTGPPLAGQLVVLAIAAALSVLATLHLAAATSTAMAFEPWLERYTAGLLMQRASLLLFLAGLFAAGLWPLSTCWVAASKSDAAATRSVLAVMLAAALLHQADAVGRAGGIDRNELLIWLATTTSLVMSLLAYAHTDVRTKVVCLLASQVGWLLPLSRVSIAGEWLTLRLAATLLATLVVSRIVEAAASRTGPDLADAGGLASRDRPAATLLTVAMVGLVGPVPLLDPDAAGTIAATSAVSSSLPLLLAIAGAITLVVAVQMVVQMLFGPASPESPGKDRRLLSGLEVPASTVLVAVVVLILFGSRI